MNIMVNSLLHGSVILYVVSSFTKSPNHITQQLLNHCHGDRFYSLAVSDHNLGIVAAPIVNGLFLGVPQVIRCQLLEPRFDLVNL